jgi:hypothetical protein
VSRAFTKFETALIGELANIASMLVDRLNAPRDPDGPEYLDLSSPAIREVIETAVRVAVTRKRLGRLRRLRQPGRRDALALGADELARLRLDGLDLDSPFTAEDLKR